MLKMMSGKVCKCSSILVFTAAVFSCQAFVAAWYDSKGRGDTATDTISGKSCRSLLDCRNIGDKFPSTKHKCSDGVCIMFFTPGQFGCKADSQCNITCRESHCNENHQCVCNNSPNGQQMLLYANKCWKECPSDEFIGKHIVPTQEGNIWICKDHSPGNFATRWEVVTRHKRQSRFFC